MIVIVINVAWVGAKKYGSGDIGTTSTLSSWINTYGVSRAHSDGNAKFVFVSISICPSNINSTNGRLLQ